MTNQFDERISSLLDGELDEQERQQVLSALEKNPELRNRWERYHLASEAIRHNLPMAIDTGFASRVMQALESEPTVLAPPPAKAVSHDTSFSKRLAGIAVAASVAAVAVLGVQNLNQEAPLPTQQMAQIPVVNMGGGNKDIMQVAENPGTTWAAPVQNPHYFDPRLNKYLVDHNQQAARAGIQGVMPYARIVAYPAGIPQEQPQ